MGARHEETEAPCALVLEMGKNRDAFLAEVRRRWRDRDSTPLLPKFEGRNMHAAGTSKKSRSK